MANSLSTHVPLSVDPRRAAQLLSISPRTLWGLTVPRGPIPVVRIGRLTRYAVADLEQYIARQRVGGDV